MALNDYEYMLRKMYQIPMFAKDKTGLTPVDRSVYSGLVTHCHAEGECNLPLENIAQMCGTTKSAVPLSLRRLRDNHLIKAEQDQFGFRGWRIKLINDYDAGLRHRTKPAITQPPEPPPPKPEAVSQTFETPRFRVSIAIEERQENTTNTRTLLS